MSEFLFNDFDSVSAKQWKQKIQYDLKGADYNDALVWQSLEGINVKPFYHQDDFPKEFQPIPGQPQTWQIAQEVFIDDVTIASQIALDALNRGAESIIFKAKKEFDFENVFKDFPFEKSPIYFDFSFLSAEFLNRLMAFFLDKNAPVFYNIDIIGNLTRTGNWFHNMNKDQEFLEGILSSNPSTNILSVDGSLYQNAGANIVQQLAYCLGQANEYLNKISSTPLGHREDSNVENNLRTPSGAEGHDQVSSTPFGHREDSNVENNLRTPSGAEGHDQVSSTPLGYREDSNIENNLRTPSGAEGKNFPMTFKLAIGSNYFFEIAKIRALRKLYSIVAREYGFKETCHILAVPSLRNKTLFDYNVNMLRTTTECMSAVLGGADTMCNLSYDSLYHKSNEFGQRIARNQLLILKYESYFDAVSNPADGTYYIESLTDELAAKALELFKEIERSGGFLKQLKEGTIQKKIKESAEKEQYLFDNGDLKLLGTNYHPNKNDRMKDNLELFPFVKNNPRKTLIVPIIARRLSEITEQERLKQES